MYIYAVISPRYLRIPVFLIGNGIVMMIISYNVCAAEWSITPRVGFAGQYNDNINLSTTNPIETSGISFLPEVRFNRTNPNSAASIGARAAFTQYSNAEVRDTDVQYLTLRSHYQPQQRSIWRLDGTLRSDTTIATARIIDIQTESTGVEENSSDFVDIDQGIVEEVDVRRNMLDLDPSWQYDFTERIGLRLDYSFRDVNYIQPENVDLTDYNVSGLETTISRKFTVKDNLGISLGLAQYNSDFNDTENISINARYAHKFEQELSGQVSVGVRNTKERTGGIETKFTANVINVRIQKRESKVTSYDVWFRHDISPSGTGVFQTDQLNISVRTRFTQRLSGLLRMQAFNTNTLEGDISSTDRTYYRVQPGFSWAMTRNWSINGSFRYRYQKRETDNDAADSNSLFVSIDYSWPKIAASR